VQCANSMPPIGSVRVSRAGSLSRAPSGPLPRPVGYSDAKPSLAALTLAVAGVQDLRKVLATVRGVAAVSQGDRASGEVLDRAPGSRSARRFHFLRRRQPSPFADRRQESL
jgi:hypothetical protein